MESRYRQPVASNVSSLGFFQVSSLLQINFTHQYLWVLNSPSTYLWYFFNLVPYLKTFELGFNTTLLTLLQQKSRTLALRRKSRKTLHFKRSYIPNLVPMPRIVRTTGVRKEAFFHTPFMHLRTLLTKPRIPLFNPTVRVRRRKYGLFQERTPFFKKIRPNWPRKHWKARNLKIHTRRFVKVRRLWLKIIMKRFGSWKKTRLARRRRKKSLPVHLSMRDARRYTNKFLYSLLQKPSLLSLLTVPSNFTTTAVNDLCKPTATIVSILTLRFLKFVTRWLFYKRSYLATLNRADLLHPFPSALQKRQTKTLTSGQVSGIGVKSFPKTHWPVTNYSLTQTETNFTPFSRKTSFIFRRYITQVFQNTTPWSTPRAIRVRRPRRFIRRKRARLPRALHFMKPHRANLKSLRSSSTFKYLFRRTSLLYRRRGFQEKRFKRLTRLGRRAVSVRKILLRRFRTNTLFKAASSFKVSKYLPTTTQTPSIKNLKPLVVIKSNSKKRRWWPKPGSRTHKLIHFRSKKFRKTHRRWSVVKSHLGSVRCDQEALELRSVTGLLNTKLQLKKSRYKFRGNLFPRLISRRSKRRLKRYFRIKQRQLRLGYRYWRLARASRGYRFRRLRRRKNISLCRKKAKFTRLWTKRSRWRSLRTLKHIFKRSKYLSNQPRSIDLQPLRHNCSYTYHSERTSALATLAKTFVDKRWGCQTQQPKAQSRRRVLAFKSLRNLPFILSAAGFLYTPRFNKQVSLKSAAFIRCTKYSFFNVLRIKRFILKERTGRYFPVKRKVRGLVSKSAPYSHTLDSNLSRQSLLPRSTFGAPSYNNFLELNQSWTLSQPWNSIPGVTYDDYRLHIRRIRFKPGYSRIWRQARTALMQVLDLKFRYQHRLTVYLCRFAHLASRVHKKLLDLQVRTLLIRSRFVFDLPTANNLVSSRLVFVNGRATLNPRMSLFVGDVLQLIVHLKFYIVYRWLLNWYTFKIQRRSRLARSKFKKVSHAQTKQRSSRLPDWLLKARSVNRDIPKFIEVDFFTLSSFVIYTPFTKNDLDILDLLDSRLEVYNMYNWKYIN